MSKLPLSRAVGRAVQIEWWQPGEALRLNCEGFTCAAERTTLPFTPSIVPVDLPIGRFRMEPFTAPQLASLEAGREYGLLILLRDGAGDPVEALELTVEVS